MNLTDNAQDKAWDSRFDTITDPVHRAALQKLFAFYDPDRLAAWFASLYDAGSGGFYYADSARDYEGFLPDIESTYQITRMMGRGMIPAGMSLPEFLGADVTAKMTEFIRSRQDPDTGYFIHPQFGKEMTMQHVMRYNRDLDWLCTILRDLRSAPLYPTPFERMKDAAGDTGTAANAEGWEPNEASVKAYVHRLLTTQDTERWSNTLSTQKSMFTATGVMDYVLDALDEAVNPEYGLWVKSRNPDGSYVNLIGTTEPAYGIYTTTYKLLILYNGEKGRRFAHAQKMAENAVITVNSRKPAIRVTYLYNPWATLTNLHANLKRFGTDEERAAFDTLVRENVAGMIDSLLVNLGDFRHADSSFSFLPFRSSPTIYGTPVSLGYDEGDVNGTLCGLCATLGAACTALGYPAIPLFAPRHGKAMLDAMRRAAPVMKKPQPAKA